jgi:hypothetical protein
LGGQAIPLGCSCRLTPAQAGLLAIATHGLNGRLLRLSYLAMKTTISTAAILVTLVCADSLKAGSREKQLEKEAKITRNQAEHLALAKVAHGRVSDAELEREHGILIWSFDITQPGTRNISEVQVDAKTGKVVSVKTETPKDQAAEAAADKKKQ